MAVAWNPLENSLTGSFTANGVSPAFKPIPGKSFNITITGNVGGNIAPGTALNGTVYLARCVDQGGVNYFAITSSGTQLMTFTSDVCESWSETQDNVSYILVCSGLANGTTINWRFDQ